MGEEVYIKQKIHHCQCLFGPPLAFLTYPNEYLVENGGGKELGKITENDNCCCQKCCPPSMRAYESRIVAKPGGQVYTAKRDCSFGQFFPILGCCCMPHVKVFDSHGQQVGSAEMTCYKNYCCYKYEIKVYLGATKDNLFRTISRCQLNCHTCCSVACCGSCGKELRFEVLDQSQNNKENFVKVHNGCYNECCTAGDMYKLTLPHSENEAALLLATVQFIDMLYFENPYSLCAP